AAGASGLGTRGQQVRECQPAEQAETSNSEKLTTAVTLTIVVAGRIEQGEHGGPPRQVGSLLPSLYNSAILPVSSSRFLGRPLGSGKVVISGSMPSASYRVAMTFCGV